MDALENNRYQLLFIDDEAPEPPSQLESLAAQPAQPKLKREKLTLSEKAKCALLLSGKVAAAAAAAAAAATATAATAAAGTVATAAPATVAPLKQQPAGSQECKKLSIEQQRQQLQQELLQQQQQQQQKPQQQKPQQQPQQQQQQQALPPAQQQQQQQQQPVIRERIYHERIIRNSNLRNRGYGGVGYGGGGGGAGYGDYGRRKFDRRANSDKLGSNALPKRNGNWNCAPQVMEQQQQQHVKSPDGQAMAGPGGGEESLQAQSERKDDTKYITVEQWQSKRMERAKPIYNIRKAGEGELNKPDWKKMIQLQQKKPPPPSSSSSVSMSSSSSSPLLLSSSTAASSSSSPAAKCDGNAGDYGDYDGALYPQRVGRMQRVVDIEFKFKDNRRRGGFLGARSARNLTKSESERASDPINMDDEVEFPTLG
ncbi:hypothetical protein KR222_004663 [Zaprionus bogoriensis]|nr:hypothetical protein KR222_004663 [Zaprionus bogoriensis]